MSGLGGARGVESGGSASLSRVTTTNSKPSTIVLTGVEESSSGRFILITGTLVSSREEKTGMTRCSFNGRVTDNYNIEGAPRLVKALADLENKLFPKKKWIGYKQILTLSSCAAPTISLIDFNLFFSSSIF